MILFIFISPLMKLQKKSLRHFPRSYVASSFSIIWIFPAFKNSISPLFISPPCSWYKLSEITVFLVTFCNLLLIIRHYIFLPLKFPFFTFFCQSCFAPRYFAQFYFNFPVLLVFLRIYKTSGKCYYKNKLRITLN